MVPFSQSYHEIVSGFNELHQAQYGFIDPSRAHVVEAVEVEAIGAGEAVEDSTMGEAGGGRTLDSIERLATVTSHMAGGWHENTAVVDRNIMLPGDTLDGPCIIREDTATTVVEPGWQAVLSDRAHLILTRVVPLPSRVAVGTDVVRNNLPHHLLRLSSHTIFSAGRAGSGHAGDLQ